MRPTSYNSFRGRDWQIELLHETSNVRLQPPLDCGLKAFVVKTRRLVEWECVVLLVLYF